MGCEGLQVAAYVGDAVGGVATAIGFYVGLRKVNEWRSQRTTDRRAAVAERLLFEVIEACDRLSTAVLAPLERVDGRLSAFEFMFIQSLNAVEEASPHRVEILKLGELVRVNLAESELEPVKRLVEFWGTVPATLRESYAIAERESFTLQAREGYESRARDLSAKIVSLRQEVANALADALRFEPPKRL